VSADVTLGMLIKSALYRDSPPGLASGIRVRHERARRCRDSLAEAVRSTDSIIAAVSSTDSIVAPRFDIGRGPGSFTKIRI
jgi:hypothetical protein